MLTLEGADLFEQTPRPGRKVRPWLVFGALGALALAALTYVIVRAIPQSPQPVRDLLRPSRLSDQTYSIEPVKQISAAQAKGMTSEPWRLVGIDGRPHSLQIDYVAGGGCQTPVGIYVHETRTSVTIEAVSRTQQGATVCASNALLGAGSVILDRPLGTRALWHAPVAGDQAGDADLLTG